MDWDRPKQIIGCYLYLLMCEILMWFIFGAREIKTPSKKLLKKMKKISNKQKKIPVFALKKWGYCVVNARYTRGELCWMSGKAEPRQGYYGYYDTRLLKIIFFTIHKQSVKCLLTKYSLLVILS